MYSHTFTTRLDTVSEQVEMNNECMDVQYYAVLRMQSGFGSVHKFHWVCQI
jgi:hypothetical protein